MTTALRRAELPAGGFDVLFAEDHGVRYPAHFHDTFAIGVVEQGYHLLHTPRGTWLAAPPAIIALAPGEVHRVEPVCSSGFTYRMMYPGVQAVCGTVPESGNDPAATNFRFREPVISDRELAIELRRLSLALLHGSVTSHPASKLAGVLRALLSRHGMRAAPSPACRPVDIAIARRAQAYLRAHQGEPVRLSGLARESGVSLCHLIRVFGRVVGVPPYAYLMQLRVNRAQQMLSEGASVSHTAFSCGFSDQSHLTRTFTRVLGYGPGRYLRAVSRAA